MALITPTDSVCTSTHAQFKSAGKFAANFVIDRPVVDICDFSKLALRAAAGTSVVSWMGTGAADFVQVNSSEFGGLNLTTDNDSFGVLWTLPLDIDPAKAIDFRLLYSSATTSGSCTFTGLYKVFDLSLATTAIAVAATAFDTAWTGQAAKTTANIPRVTPWGSIAAATAAVAALEGGNDQLGLHVTVDVTTESPVIYKMQARYYRKFV